MVDNLYALLVGIDEYPNLRDQLEGCVNDITAIAEYLKERYDKQGCKLHLRELKNQQATRQAIIDGFRQHLCRAESNDVVLFYYSGHGSQEQAPEEFWYLEPDKLIETLVCYDSRSQGGWDLADKELAQLIAEVSKKNPHICIILDCCYSGSGTRDPLHNTRVRHAPLDTQKEPRPLDKFIFSLEELEQLSDSSNYKTHPTGLKIPKGCHVLLAACQDNERTQEIFRNDQKRGAFSYYLLDTLQQTNGKLTYRDLLKRANALVRIHADQSPQIEVTDPENENQFFLNSAIAERTTPYFTVSYNKNYGWVIDGGAVHGVQRPTKSETTLLALFPFESNIQDLHDSSKCIGKAEVTQVLPQLSRVKIGGVENLDQSQLFKAVVTSLPLPPLGVYFEGDRAGLELARQAMQAAGLDNQPSSYICEEKQRTNARLVVVCCNQQYLITRPTDDRPLVAEINDYTEENAETVIKRLEHIARWITIAELPNSGNGLIKAGDVEIKFVPPKDNDIDVSQLQQMRFKYRYDNGEWKKPACRIKLTNKSQKSLYCALLDLGGLFDITSPFFREGSVRLDPGQEVWALDGENLNSEVPEVLWSQGITEYTDIIKLIVSTAKFDARLSDQKELDASQQQKVGTERGLNQSILSRLMIRVQDRAFKAENPERLEDWFTEQVIITTIRPLDATPVSDTESKDLGFGVTLQPHPTLTANARLTTVPENSRDLGNMILPPILRENSEVTQPFEFATSRSTAPGLSVLELSGVENFEVVTPDAPLRLLVDTQLSQGEHLLAVGYDGEFFLPLGQGKRTEDSKTEILLERLSEPVSQGSRSLTGSIRIFFQKVFSPKLGHSYHYPRLALAEIIEQQTRKNALTYHVTYLDSLEHKEEVKAAIAQSQKIVLYIHGIIGDTESMIPSLQTAKVNGEQRSLKELYDLVLAFDYENLNTTIEENAKKLGERLQDVGLGVNHGKQLDIVAHSMGGLVSRWFIEHEGGNQVVQHLVMLGTPNNGSPWPTVQEWAFTMLGVGLNQNRFCEIVWPANIIPRLLDCIDRNATVTLKAMKPNSPFLQILNSEPDRDPGMAYTIIAGDRSLRPDALRSDSEDNSSPYQRLLKKLFGKLVDTVVDKVFFEEPNDIAVRLTSIKAINLKRSPQPRILPEVACDHLTYFNSPEGLKALSEALAPKKKIERYISTALKEDAVIHTSEQKDSLPSQPPSVRELNLTSQEQLAPTQQSSPVSSTSKSSHEFENSFAIVIGINNYQRKPLQTAVNDAEKISDLLQNQYGYKVQFLKNEQATKERLKKLFEDLKNNQITIDDNKENITNKDRLFFYFAGHGIGKDPYDDREELAGFLLPQDAVIDDRETYIKMQECHDALINLQCRHMLAILDCCFAGSFRWASLTRKFTPEDVTLYKQRYDRFIKDPAWQVITSAAQDQTASDLLGQRGQKDNGQHSPFAEVLLGALKGQIEEQIKEQKRKDFFSNNIITATKLYSYLREEVEPQSEELYKRQTPEIWHLRKHSKGEYIFLLPEFQSDKLENAPALNAENNPYRGLESYEEEHSHLFFGRDRQIKKLYEKVDQNTFTVVVGAPGTGKSSLVKAGLIPNWRREQLKYLEEQLKGLQKLEDSQEQEEQLKLKHRKKDLEEKEKNLKHLKKEEENLREKLRKANSSQELVAWRKELEIISSQHLLEDLTQLIKPLQETEETIKKICEQQKTLDNFNNQLEEAKNSQELEYLQKQLKIESSQYLEDFEKIEEQIREVLQNIKIRIDQELEQNITDLEARLEEKKSKLKEQLKIKYNQINKSLKVQLENSKKQFKAQLKNSKEQLETQLKNSKKQWYIIVRPGESPIEALNKSLDRILGSTTPNQTYEQREEDTNNWLNKLLNLFFLQFNTSKTIQKENNKLDDKLVEWKNHSLKWLGDKRLLVIDQFEELITLCENEEERENFLNWLVQTIKKNSEWLRILLTVRSDFEPQFQNSVLKQYWTEAKFVDLDITRSELQQAIEEPATVKAINFELDIDKNYKYLVDKLLDEVGQTQGALPLVSFILYQLYDKLSEKNDYESRTLTLEDYEKLGGVTEVLTKTLESEYEKFVPRDISDELLDDIHINSQNFCEHLQKRFIGFYLLAEWQEAQTIVEGEVVKFRNYLEELLTTDTTLSNEQNLVEDSQRKITFYFLGERQEEQAIGEFKEIKSLSVDREELSTSATIPITDETSPRSQHKLSVTCPLPPLAGKFHYLILISPLLSQYLNLKGSFQKFEESCKKYEKFCKQYEQHKESYQKWDKTIRNVMLRMVAVDSQLARRRVLMSELKYPQLEENKRVDQVIQAFVDAHLLVQYQSIVEPVHDVLVLKWDRLITWTKDANENVPLSLRRRLTQDIVDWQKNEKEQTYLWRNKDQERRLVLLEEVSNSDDNWLNKLEDEFVKESVKQRQIQGEEELSKVIESRSISRQAAIFTQAEREYKKFINSEQLDRELQSSMEKTIRNVMLRMVVVDGVELARRRVLESELVYPKPEENERVNQVVEAFVREDLLLRVPQGENIYVELNCDLVQAWDRLRIWTQNQKEHLILLRWLTPEAVSWQDNNKEPSFLWDRNRHLDSLEKVVKLDDNWLNQLENEFVNKSIDKKRSDLTKSRILGVSSLILATLVFGIFSSIVSTRSSTAKFGRNGEISSGEKILTTPDQLTWLKQTGVQAIATNNFDKAVKYLEEYRDKQPNDPEALIYLNNARIGNQNSYTIATSVPISSDVNGALEMLRGVAQAQDEINKAKGINDVPLRVLIADDNNNPDVAKQIAKKFIQDSKVLGVVGHYSSDATLAASEIYNSGKLVAISPVSTAMKLKGFSNYIFRTVPSDAVARKLADYMQKQLGKKKAAVFYSSKSEDSQSLKKEFVSAIASTKDQLANELVFDLSNSDFDANHSVERAIQQGAEVLVLLANTKELDNALQVVKANHKRLLLLAGDDVYTPKVLKEGAEDAVDMIVSVPWHILAESKSDFVKTSKELWRGAEINWRTAMSYDATRCLISGIKQNPTREGVAKTLLSTSFTVKGATGEIKFSSGERYQADIQLVEIKKKGSSSRSGYGYDFEREIKKMRNN